MANPSNVVPLLAYSYRQADRHDVPAVTTVLQSIIDAQPTQFHPDEREGFLNSLLEDLEQSEGATWRSWPEGLLVLALTAIRYLGRNPVGSETLTTEKHINIIASHAGLLPTSPPSWPSASLEALKVLANLLVLHPISRKRFARVDGPKSVAQRLRTCKLEDVERLFLLARIGFLATVERPDAVRAMMDEGIVERCAQCMSLARRPPNLAMFSEVLKLSTNLVRYFPYQSSAEEPDPWDPSLDPLLCPSLGLLYTLPMSDLAPPMAQTIHLLLSIPFIPSLVLAWMSPPPPSEASTMQSLFNKLSTLSTPTDLRPSAARSKSPGPTMEDPTALPKRLMQILETFFTAHLPGTTPVDAQLSDDAVLDEALPPLLLLLAQAAGGVPAYRDHLKASFFPSSLDRTDKSGPLERRSGMLGTMLRLMGSTNHPQCRDTAGELIWAVCDGDASTVSAEIGYGNAAGLLFRKGLSGPPPGRVQEIVDDSTEESSAELSAVNKATVTTHATSRDPITSLKAETTPAHDTMTQEEKEREADRLFELFDRMEKNPVISMRSGEEDTKGNQSVKEAIKERMQSGEMDHWDHEAVTADFEKQRQEEEADDNEVAREMAAYRKRQGR